VSASSDSGVNVNEKCSTLMGDIFFFSGSTGTVGAWINDMNDSLVYSAHNNKFNVTLDLNNVVESKMTHNSRHSEHPCKATVCSE
jgi:hypothetical protein